MPAIAYDFWSIGCGCAAGTKTGTVTLLYGSHDGENNNAVALKRYLEAKLAHRQAAPRAK